MPDGQGHGTQENLAEGPGIDVATGQNPPSTTPAGAGAENGPGANEPSKFQNKSRAEILASYTALEKTLQEKAETINQAQAWIKSVEDNFVADQKTGRIEWNDEQLARLAKNRLGYIPQDQANKPPEVVAEEKEALLNKFEDNPQQTMKEMLGELLEQKLNERLQPVIQDVQTQKMDKWIAETKNKHPDFAKYQSAIHNFCVNNNFTLDTKDKLEIAYKAAKAIEGGFVDAGAAEAKEAELIKTIQAFNPGAGTASKPFDENSASVDDLLGLGDLQTKKADTIRDLFGKATLSPID